ncbi:MAG: hypothetical protein JO069_02245 [Verrucomicrobia bacterium]|nr:hypothetical protein [Verrucomicrobiota bacterium]
MPSQTSRQSIGQGGYLLLEVLLGLAILTMVTALVFRIIQTTVRTTHEVTYLESLQERVDGISELLRQNFSSLQSIVQFQTKSVQGGTELVFRQASFQFTATPGVPIFGTVALGTRPQKDGRLSLMYYQEPENAREHLIQSNREDRVAWTPLLENLEQIAWRFFDQRNHSWRVDWVDNAARPALVELTFRLAGQNQVHRVVLRWPTAVITTTP